MAKIYRFKSKILVYHGMGAWRFLVLPVREAGEIKQKHSKNARGWGSLPVSVTIGNTAWDTSIFPDRKSGTYLLPLKAQVRKKEDIFDEDEVSFLLKLK